MFILSGWFVRWEAAVLWGTASRICSNSTQYPCLTLIKHFSMSASLKVVQLYNSIDMATASKNSYFISSERLNFFKVDNLWIVIYAFSMHMLISLSIDEISLPRYMKWSSNFRGLSFNVEMVLSCLKLMHIHLCVCAWNKYKTAFLWANNHMFKAKNWLYIPFSTLTRHELLFFFFYTNAYTHSLERH